MLGGSMQRSVDGPYLDLERVESQVTSAPPVVPVAPVTTATPVLANNGAPVYQRQM